MNATQQAPSKKADDKGYFLQLPCVLLEAYSTKLSATAYSTLMRFLSEYLTWERDKAEYSGSYRALSRRFEVSCSTLIKAVSQWAEYGFAQVIDTPEQLTITVNLSPLWQQNIVYSRENKKQSRPKNGQKVELSKKQTVELSKFEALQRLLNCSDIQKIDTAVQILDALVQKIDSLERDGESIKNLEELTKNTIAFFGKEDSNQHSCGCANATPHLRLVEDLDPLSEDLLEAQPKSKQSSIAYSQESQSTTQQTLFDADLAYTKNENPPSQEKKPKRPKQPKVELTPEQHEQCRRWLTHFEKVRGEPFETKEAKINAAKYIKMLVLKYDETTIMRIYKHLSEKDFKWSKPSFKFKITPYVVYTEAPSVLQQLGGYTDNFATNKRESMDDREARIRAAEKAYEEEEKARKAARLAREAQERMVKAQ